MSNCVIWWEIGESFRKLGHCWTTDNIVTAHVAIQERLNEFSSGTSDNSEHSLRYLDLGCGNVSVLQMVSWDLLLNKSNLTAYGIKARSEAVGLARRSLSFNVGPSTSDSTSSSFAEKNVSVIHGDFRDLERDEVLFQDKDRNMNNLQQLEDFCQTKS